MRTRILAAATAWLATGAAAMTAAPSTGCLGLSCTLVGWDEGLTVLLTRDFEPLPAGAYHFSVNADGEQLDLDVTVLPDGGLLCAAPAEDCSLERELDGRSVQVLLDGSRLIIGYFGGGDGGPAEVALAITRNDVELMRELFVPTYEVDEPNGPGCGESHQATVDVTEALATDCAPADWYEGLSVLFAPDPIPAGSYLFEVVADGVPIEIDAVVDGAGDWSCPVTGRCQATQPLDDGRTLHLWFEFNQLVIMYGGYGGGPAEAAVTVLRGGVEIAAETFTPTYAVETPGGPGCTEATTAEVVMEIP